MKKNKISIGIVADDLTSATDGAGPFWERGYSPLILRGIQGFEDAEIVAIDTDSRVRRPEEAGEVTRAAVKAVSSARLVFKTIDSTLRGNIAAEVEAAFRASGRARMVIAPAFPGAGRRTRHGIQIVDDVPVHLSDYAHDPAHPARTARIADLLPGWLGEPGLFPQDVAPSDIPAGHLVLILDADTQEALDAQVARVPDPESVLWVGSPGLAIALAGMVRKKRSRLVCPWPIDGRLLVVAGSANPVTHAQCNALSLSGIRVVGDLAHDHVEDRAVCLRAPSARASAEAVLTTLADAAAAAVIQGRFNALIATGGETMAAILDRLAIRKFVLASELEPGFPTGLATMEGERGLLLAMKAGGFGDASSLLRASARVTGIPIGKR